MRISVCDRVLACDLLLCTLDHLATIRGSTRWDRETRQLSVECTRETVDRVGTDLQISAYQQLYQKLEGMRTSYLQGKLTTIEHSTPEGIRFLLQIRLGALSSGEEVAEHGWQKTLPFVRFDEEVWRLRA